MKIHPAGVDIHDMQYLRPTRKDLAVGLVYFSCTKSKRLMMNYLYMTDKLRRANIPYYTLEMHLQDEEPQIIDAIHLTTDFIFYQSERLYRVLESHIPKYFTKIVYLDADVVFDNPNWYNDLSDKLDQYNIVQPFETAKWLDLTYKNVYFQKKTAALIDNNHECKRVFDYYHDGFAWGFQRKWYQDVGLYDYDILAYSHRISVIMWLNIKNYSSLYCPPYNNAMIDEFKRKLQNNMPTIGYLQGTTLYSLYHGSYKNRRYRNIWKILKSVKDIRDIIYTDTNGVFRLKPSGYKYKSRLSKYFIDRDDDSL